MEKIEDLARDVLADSDDRLIAAYLFGSFARGTATSTSDVDIGLLFREPVAGRLGDRRFTIERELERRLGRSVQAVVLNDAPVDLVHRVFRDGVLVVDRDASARIQFEVAVRNHYFDLLPILELYRRQRAIAP